MIKKWKKTHDDNQIFANESNFDIKNVVMTWYAFFKRFYTHIL